VEAVQRKNWLQSHTSFMSAMVIVVALHASYFPSYLVKICVAATTNSINKRSWHGMTNKSATVSDGRPEESLRPQVQLGPS
jgi:hypothetical protein